MFTGDSTLSQTLNVAVSRHYTNHRLSVNSTLSVSAVDEKHSGTYTCTAVNEAGVATATTQLTVLGEKMLDNNDVNDEVPKT